MKTFKIKFDVNTQTKLTEDWEGTTTRTYGGKNLVDVVAYVDAIILGYNQAVADLSEEDVFPDILKIQSITIVNLVEEGN